MKTRRTAGRAPRPRTAQVAVRRPPRVLIVGCGDIGLRLAGLLRARGGRAPLGLVRDPGRVAELRAVGVRPLAGDLDDRRSLARLAGVADWVVHLAPPPAAGDRDRRSRALLAALARRAPPRRLVYVSTSGVYGDCGGAWLDETRPPRPRSERARRRLDAERRLRDFARRRRVRLTVLRAPGIYAGDRLPAERLRRSTPALRAEEDVYTNHVHADDLARACLHALCRGRPLRVYHACDGEPLRAGDYLDAAADALGLPRPPRIALADAPARLPATLLSFLSESRRLSNRRLSTELRLRLRFPSVAATLARLPPARREL